jgi:hypothetical protein
MKTDCRFCEDVNAYVTGELEPSELASFEAHLADCAKCQAAVQSTRSLVSRLRSVPEIESSRDFAALALAEGREEPRSAPGSSRWPRLAAIAALVAILAVATAILNSVRDEGTVRPKVADTEETAVGLIRARDWFVRNQEADGSWNAERWGGHKNYAPALTALPLLALTSGDGSKPEHEAAANRAVAWLLKQQNPDGTFGPVVQGGPYNQSIATLALLHAYQRSRDTVPKSALDSAVVVLTAAQMPEGGWGYRYSPLSDRSITQWHVQALELAASLDWKSARASVERGLTWLSSHSKPLDDSAEPRTRRAPSSPRRLPAPRVPGTHRISINLTSRLPFSSRRPTYRPKSASRLFTASSSGTRLPKGTTGEAGLRTITGAALGGVFIRQRWLRFRCVRADRSANVQGSSYAGRCQGFR